MGNRIRAVAFAVKKLYDIVAKRGLSDIQEKYDAKAEKIIKLILTDIRRPVVFQVKDGVLNYKLRGAEEIEADIEGHMTSDTFFNLLAGRIKVLNHRTDKKEYRPYNYYDAYRWGDVNLYGDMANNDNQKAMEIFSEGVKDLQDDLHSEMRAQTEDED